MFIGSINRYMRAVLERAGAQWKGLPVYVACCGNFTVERILARCGVGPIHSNDVSIYSCALGWHVSGQDMPYKVRLPEFAWLGDYLHGGAATVATLLLAGEMLKIGGDNAYTHRMHAEYRRRWPVLHPKTVERVKKATAGLSIASYFAGDCREFLAQADKGAGPGGQVCISFPPTYERGYERLYKRLEAIFDWPADDFEAFSQTVRGFRHWMVSSDVEQPALAAQHVATVQTSLREKPVFMYCDASPRSLATAHQNIGRNPWPPHTEEVAAPPEVVPIDCKTMNAIRSMYLSHSIAVCDAPRNYAVLSAGRLLGAFSFALPRSMGFPCDIYLLSDFAVRPSPHRRLSKLILACVVSREVQADLDQWLCSRIKSVGTTAFTEKAVSMKYRGLFEVHNRAEGRVNYLGAAGRWGLMEGYQWWKTQHSAK